MMRLHTALPVVLVALASIAHAGRPDDATGASGTITLPAPAPASAPTQTKTANDKPLYAPAPAWVKPAPPIDFSKLDNESPVLLLFDNQQKLENGQVWNYFETETRAASPQALSTIGTVSLPWQPDHGNLIIHTAEIIRNGEHIDLIKGGQPFTVLRREQQLNQQIINGTLTATLPVEGLRVGDVLHMAVSITMSDTTLKGKLATAGLLLRDPMRVQYGRLRLLWPAGATMRWRNYSGATIADPVTANGYRDLSVTLPLPKEADIPHDAPARFKPLPLLEATDFTDWPQVSATLAPLYKTDGLIDPKGPIAAEIDRIKAATTDPTTRAAMALQVVQEKIRYQLIALNTGNLVPQTPAETWSLRYGDCKAKTLLLLAMLHQMDIEAEPVLASIQASGLVSTRLPSVSAFDHVFVRAVVGNDTLWLDGTGLGARLSDIHDVPPLGYVLPVHEGGSALIALPRRADARPSVATTIDIDNSAGLALPAPFRISITLRGAAAEQLRLFSAQASSDDIDSDVEKSLNAYLDSVTVGSRKISYDEKLGTATLTATGVTYPDWQMQDERYRLVLNDLPGAIKFDPDRARAAWNEIPVDTGRPDHITLTIARHLPPGKAFTLEGADDLDTVVASNHIVRRTRLVDDTVTVDLRRTSDGNEIAAADIAAERRKLVALQAQSLRAVAKADYPNSWVEVADAARLHKLEPIAAVYTARIAEKPKEATRYTDRAWYYEQVYDWQKARADLDRAIALAPAADMYLTRAKILRGMGNKAAALSDAKAALALDPKSQSANMRVAWLLFETGDKAGGLALLQEGIDRGGDERFDYITGKAEMLGANGDVTGAIALLDATIAKTPGRPDLLNSRCWVKGTHKTALDTALKDCTKAIELADSADAALDSRAVVYLRMNRLDDAAADLDAVLAHDPDMVGSLYLRGLVRQKKGDAAGAAADLAAARGMSPGIDAEYRERYELGL